MKSNNKIKNKLSTKMMSTPRSLWILKQVICKKLRDLMDSLFNTYGKSNNSRPNLMKRI